VLRRGDLVVAVGTEGAAPALAAAVRDALEEHLDAALGDWVALLKELRPLVLASIADETRRGRTFAELADWRWLERLKQQGRDEVRREMEEVIRRRATLADG
jgi:siroheme synthase-like protein